MIEMKFTGLEAVIAKLKEIQLNASLVVSTSLVGTMRTRIHEEGKASDGAQIGVYSTGYMSVRTGQFKSNSTVTKGKKKGETRTTGVFTKGKNKGSTRPSYNRTGDTKVILSLTRQQESDFSIIEVNGSYGVGYKNSLNFDKSKWEEATYKKPIFTPTAEEDEMATQALNEYAQNVLS